LLCELADQTYVVL